ncbi:MAG: metal ABC transporter permease [Planctomycetes bacterium]|nr:metal ABC transporter permease [Planctomycetota bacterium]
MEWTSLDTWIVVAGALSAAACALLGNFLIMRRLSMMGDAISHAVLPGLAVGFLLTGSRGGPTLFLGAAIVGVLTALFTEWVLHFGQVEQSASMGVVFTTLFAIGLILIVRAADKVDLDPGCVLYGAIELVPLDTMDIRGWAVPRAVLTLGSVFLLDLAFVLLFYKELRISAFDPELATALGFNAHLLHYLLMTFVAITTVASFESVGSILVIAMLIVPGATASLLTERLHTLLLASVAIAVLSAVAGHAAAITVPGWWGYSDTTTAGGMAVVAGLLFTLAFFFAPRHGIASKFLHRARLSIHITRQDILGLLFRLEEMPSLETRTMSPALLRKVLGAGAMLRWLSLRGLLRAGLVRLDGGGYRLTSTGREEARSLIRSHRLWESYLYQHLHLPADHLHGSAERLEHVTDPVLQRRLSERVERPEIDPHGKRIPS